MNQRSRSNHRQLIPKGMISRSGRKNPFQSRPLILIFFVCPRIVPTLRCVSQSPIHNQEEIQETQPAKVRPVRTQNIPPLKSIRIVQISTRHSRQPQKVLRKEGKIHTNKELKEMCLSMSLRILTSSKFGTPKVEGRKNSKNCPHTLHIMKVRHHIISIMQSNVHTPIGLNNSSQSSKGELHLKALSEQHRSSQPQRSTVQSPEPTENFNSSRHGNNHGSPSKVATSIHVQAHSIHVVCPHLESENCNSSHGIHHSYVSKHRFSAKKAQHMTNHSKPRLNQHVNFRVTKEPKLVLILDNITSSCRQEEARVKVSVSQLHGQSCGKHRQTSNLLNADKALSPHKQRQAIQSHSLSSHVGHSHKKVNRSQNGSNTSDMQPKNSLINRSSRVTQSTTQRRIGSPPNSGPLFYLCTQLLKSLSHWQHPKTNVVHSRESHIYPSDHHGNQPVPETTHKSRHNHKENHLQTVSCDLHVVKLSISRQNPGTCIPQLHSNQQTHSGSHHTAPPSKSQILHANIFGVSATKPPHKLRVKIHQNEKRANHLSLS